MVDIIGSLVSNRKPIIMIGLIIGALKILDLLPATLPLVTTYTKFVYLGIIVIAVYLFYTSYWETRSVAYTQKVVPRSLSNPNFNKDLKRQMEGYEPQPIRQPKIRPSSDSSANTTSPSKDVFDRFNKDD